jgi:acetate kinase
MNRPLESLKLILCHLGTGGSSVAAVKDGQSLDTSMGYSPLPGLVMSTRCGDIDAEIVLDLIRAGRSPDEVSQILNNQSGLMGLSGFSSNLAEIIEEAEKGNQDCQVAYDVYAHRLKSYIGSFHWLLDGADTLVFTDDIGQKSWKLREKVCTGLRPWAYGWMLRPTGMRQPIRPAGSVWKLQKPKSGWFQPMRSGSSSKKFWLRSRPHPAISRTRLSN